MNEIYVITEKIKRDKYPKRTHSVEENESDENEDEDNGTKEGKEDMEN